MTDIQKTNIEAAARNRETGTIPLYEHFISSSVLETILGKKLGHLAGGNGAGAEDSRSAREIPSRITSRRRGI